MALLDHGNYYVCSYTICVILAVIALTISIGIGTYFAYKYMNHWYLKKRCYLCYVWYSYSNNLMNLQMGKVQQIEIKNRTNYFYNDIINIEEFNSSLLK